MSACGPCLEKWERKLEDVIERVIGPKLTDARYTPFRSIPDTAPGGGSVER